MWVLKCDYENYRKGDAPRDAFERLRLWEKGLLVDPAAGKAGKDRKKKTGKKGKKGKK